jgi:hypothetical protein
LLVHLRHSQTRLPFSLSTHLLSTFTLPVPKYLTLIATARAKILDVFFLIWFVHAFFFPHLTVIQY